jgi:tyrosyl-tRNA synthetase
VLPIAEIDRLASLGGAEINEAKKILASAATTLLHGSAEAAAAEATARKTFEAGELAETLPTVDIDAATLGRGLGVLNAFVAAGLAASNGEARRQAQGGGLRVNDRPVTDVRTILTQADLGTAGVIKLSLGRKRHILLRPR